MLRMILLLAGLGVPAAATAQAGFERCAAIEPAAERLACFDALTRNPTRETATGTEALGRAPAAPAEQGLTPQPIVSTVPPRADPVERFGAENLPEPDAGAAATDRIESRLTGRFSGWTRDTVFELDNGQAWQCQNCRPVYHQAESPQVSIRRGFTGVYWLKIEGLNQQAKVRRVR